jgi:hypothetical protein
MMAGPRQNVIPSIFIVEVVGFGGSDQDAIDRERKRRQQH